MEVAHSLSFMTANDLVGKPVDASSQEIAFPQLGVCRWSSSVNAADLEEGLTTRGFEVTRLNTYTTEPVSHVDRMVFEEALSASVVAVASPSAVRAWAILISEPEYWKGSVACIGETTASAAKKLGLRSVYHPTNPGLQGWVDSILDALKVHNQLQKV